jgi:hypothetical protein
LPRRWVVSRVQWVCIDGGTASVDTPPPTRPDGRTAASKALSLAAYRIAIDW